MISLSLSIIFIIMVCKWSIRMMSPVLADLSGAYDEEESAAGAYDLAALKFWGTSTYTNFPVRT